MKLFLTFLFAVAGGTVQSTVGFGSAIVMLMFIPSFLPLTTCTAITTASGVGISGSVALRYRKHIHFKKIPLPLIIYCLAGTLAIRLSLLLNLVLLKRAFGIFLLLMAGYFLFVSDKVKLKADLKTTFACAGLAGTSNGLFGIGGPPMVPYFLSIFPNDKYAYLATTQMYFVCTSLVVTTVRLMNGIITAATLPYILISLAGMVTGSKIGAAIVDKIDVKQLQKLIYCFLALSGLLTVLGVT